MRLLAMHQAGCGIFAARRLGYYCYEKAPEIRRFS